ncbi:MAG: hypothetical protein M3164_00595, partial [Actinomycetota bacterium]|nr:hypothetical protein [Actinomycetota bacterium]
MKLGKLLVLLTMLAMLGALMSPPASAQLVECEIEDDDENVLVCEFELDAETGDTGDTGDTGEGGEGGDSGDGGDGGDGGDSG